MRRLTALGFATLVGALALATSPAHATPGRVALSPDPANLARGESTTLTVTLDEPMICIEADPCQLVLDLSTGLPEGFTLSPSVVTIAANQWWQPVQLTATLDVDAPAIDGNEFTISGTADSGSEYYDAFQTSVTFTIEPDAPAAEDELAHTGIGDGISAAFAASLLSVIFASALISRRRRSR